MAILAFSHYNLRVPAAAVEELRRFYCDVLGLTQGPRPPLASHGHWLYAGAQDVLHLSQMRPGEQRDGGAVNAFDHAAFRCSDRAAHERRLQQAGVPFRVVQLEDGTVQVFLRDPAGNGVELNFAPGSDAAPAR